jgi:hypothetical protein
MLFDRIRRAARIVERLSGPDTHAVVAVNTGGKGRVKAVSSVSTPRRGGDGENEAERTSSTDQERRGPNAG